MDRIQLEQLELALTFARDDRGVRGVSGVSGADGAHDALCGVDRGEHGDRFCDVVRDVQLYDFAFYYL